MSEEPENQAPVLLLPILLQPVKRRGIWGRLRWYL